MGSVQPIVLGACSKPFVRCTLEPCGCVACDMPYMVPYMATDTIMLFKMAAATAFVMTCLDSIGLRNMIGLGHV